MTNGGVMEPSPTGKSGKFLDRVSVYGLEFAVAMITLVISVSVLSFAVFALCNYFAYSDAGAGRGYFALWSSASTIVWVPVALIFYLRVRAYIAGHPEIATNSVQRVFTLIYDVLIILTIISFAVAAVYAGLTSLVKPDETGSILLGVALPSAVSALLFGGALLAFFKTPVVRRRTFALVFMIVTALIIIPTIVTSVISLRSANADQVKETDLYQIKSAIDEKYSQDRRLPASLNDIDTYINEDGTKHRLGDYSYKTVNATRYELCTNFDAVSSYRSVTPMYGGEYQSYANFDSHKAGKNCYKLRVVSSSSGYPIE